ncbi:MAG TPA: hypothetical protein VG347_24415 [Verrucomicrobiae bacterium]|nr:hypothetical protein [Verrucomicrobiae bacterium]
MDAKVETKLDGLLKKMKLLEDELLVELQAKEKQFCYEVRQRKVHFSAETSAKHRKLVRKLSNYLVHARWMSIITTPAILSCIIPAALLDAWTTAYQFICFPAYGIPKVRRADYVIMDRNKLRYLNTIERINCVYCEYVNGVIAYAQEIAGRTEQHWCPIKHALRLKTMHSRYKHFVDYGDAEEYRKRVEQIRRDFDDLKTNKAA